MDTITESVKKFIKTSGAAFFSADGFCELAAAELGTDKDAIAKTLPILIADGFLIEQNNKYVQSAHVGLQPGTLTVNPKGFGFVEVDPEKPDIFIAADNLNGAVHGDRVLVKTLKANGRKVEGEINTVLVRGVQNIVGTVVKSPGGAFVIPDDDRLGQSFELADGNATDGQITIYNKSGFEQAVFCEAISGQKVVAHFDKDVRGRVRITELLGSQSRIGVDILSIIRAHNLYEEFPNDVLTESQKVAKMPSDGEIARRMDLRDKMIITIDPEDAKDLDDAVSLTKNADGTYELGVHIADVSHYVAEGSLLDAEAFKRGTSVYFPDRVLPMLPPELSNGICSLLSQSRLALSVFMSIDKTGAVTKRRIDETIIKVDTRFCYNDVQKILDGDKELCKTHKKLVPMLKDMAELTHILEGVRRKRGEVVFDVPEPKIILDPETGKIKDVIAYPHHLSHRIIETFMVLCNEVVAEKICGMELPFVYRIHDKPDELKVAKFVETLKPFGVQHNITPEHPTNHAYQKMLGGLPAEIKPIISQLALRSMQKAKYAPECVGHFGLAARYYCHFTSPIRRYPDLAIHRIIKLMINRKLSSHKIEELKEFVLRASIQSSKTELEATEAEREVDNLKRAEYMHDRIGEVFGGIISGIADFGVFVYLPNTVEGLIKIENMPRDTYTFNEKQMTLVGRKRTFKMGDPITVIVAGVNLARRQVEFAAKQ